MVKSLTVLPPPPPLGSSFDFDAATERSRKADADFMERMDNAARRETTILNLILAGVMIGLACVVFFNL